MSFLNLAKQMMELMMPHLSDSDKLDVINVIATSLSEDVATTPKAENISALDDETESESESESEAESADERMFTKGGHQLLASLDQRPFRKSINFKTDYYNGCTNERTIAITKAMKTYTAARETFTPWSVAEAVFTSLVTTWGNTMRNVRYHMGKIVEDGDII